MLSSVILAFELIKKGVHIIRVHDIKETSEMLKIFNGIPESIYNISEIINKIKLNST